MVFPRPIVIRVMFCAQKLLPTSLSNGCQTRVFNIINKFLLQTKSVCTTKPHGVNIVSKILYLGFPLSCLKRSSDFLPDIGFLTY